MAYRPMGLSVTLQRDGLSQPWGIRLIGGCDLGKPIIITRACLGTPAEGLVKPGDEVLQIGDYDSRDLRHVDAQTLFKNAGNSINLVINRVGPDLSSKSNRDSNDPLGLPRALGPHPEYEIIAPTSFNKVLDINSRCSSVSSPYKQELEDEMHAVTDQPYRTTPLVLPGAKVKKDFGPTESYLRHHPNPMFRQAPPHPLLQHEIAMKQRVADTVLQKIEDHAGPSVQICHKPYNSPIGLYSEQNIVNTINSTTPANLKKTIVYDPVKSETYKALHDQEIGDYAQEVTSVPTKVFAPVKQSPRAVPHALPSPHTMNATGQSQEEIQQSNTFKRLMHMVQTEGVY